MTLPLKDRAKLGQIVERIQAGSFDENDVDNLLVKLRPYAGKHAVFLEVAHFVAHPDARDRGLAQQSITAFVDSIQYFQEYVAEKRSLNLSEPFPAYIHRLLVSQVRLSDERRLKADFKMSHRTLIKKIESNFSIDKKAGTCSLRSEKGGTELLAALQFVMRFIHSRAAFHIRDFHKELQAVMREQGVTFDDVAWSRQTDRVSLAVLCLISNTAFVLANGGSARCKVDTENHFRILSGQRRLPTGISSSEPTTFGRLMIMAEATVCSMLKRPLRIGFPLIETDLDPHEHCDTTLFAQDQAPDDWGSCEVEVINFAKDMSLSRDFKLVRTDSLI